jgi:radical SAM superfamily enzyme YgiQ (UPF0313 family)
MKICLIAPKGAMLSKEKEFTEFWNNSNEISLYKQFWSGANTGLLTVAALTNPEYEIDYIDENFSQIDFDNHYDIVGITANTQQVCRAYKIAENFRKRGVYTVIGGMHVTVLPQEAQQYVDTVICGEAEYMWPEFLGDFTKGKPKSLYQSEKIIQLAD